MVSKDRLQRPMIDS